MNSRCSNDPHYPDLENSDSAGYYVEDWSLDRYPCDPCCQTISTNPTVILLTQHPAMWAIPDPLCQPPTLLPPVPYIIPAPSLQTDNDYSHVGITPMDSYPIPPQPTGLPYTDGAIQAPSQNALGRDPVEEDHQLHACLTPRKLVLQETYKPPKQQKELGTIQSIDFSVCGKRGICLSDAVDEKWAGFDGRDDRPSFGGDRFTIMLRLRFVGCPPWQSKVSTVDYTVRRQPIVRTKLANVVAKSVKKFLEREKAIGHSDKSQCAWQEVPLSNMYLTRLVQVSTASWQPEIFVAEPTLPNDDGVIN